MRRAAKVDGNHSDIVQALRKVGCQVRDMSGAGQGFPDLLVRVPRSGGLLMLLEVKNPQGRNRSTPQQKAFYSEFPETIEVRSVDEALRAVGVRL